MSRRDKKKSEVLCRFYGRRISSFYENLQKARLSGYKTDVHKLRVDLRKLITLVDLLEACGKPRLKSGEYRKILKDLFGEAGKLRETQMNLSFLDQCQPHDFDLLAFRYQLECEEKKHLRNFQHTASGIDEKSISAFSKKIYHRIEKLDYKKFRQIAQKLISKKGETISLLRADLEKKKNAHRIRRHLKSIATVVTVTYLIKPDEDSIHYLSDINRTEKMLGNWHDKMIFLRAIDRFLAHSLKDLDRKVLSVQQLKATTSEACDAMLAQFYGLLAY
jgi:CHAD domain-containing protein